MVRGGSGSGKSWLVREFLRSHSVSAETLTIPRWGRGRDPERHVQYIQAHTLDNNGFTVLGRYDMDGLSPGKGGEALPLQMWEELLLRYDPVLFEANVGCGKDLWARLVTQTRVVWATMDTPADECIRRIYERRERTGRNLGKPLKEDRMLAVAAARLKEATNPPPGVESYWLDHRDPLPQLMYLLGS